MLLMSVPSPSRLALVMGVGLIAVSLSAIFIRLADAPGVVVAAYRMVLASLVLLPWTLRALKRTPPHPTKRRLRASGRASLRGSLRHLDQLTFFYERGREHEFGNDDAGVGGDDELAGAGVRPVVYRLTWDVGRCFGRRADRLWRRRRRNEQRPLFGQRAGAYRRSGGSRVSAFRSGQRRTAASVCKPISASLTASQRSA